MRFNNCDVNILFILFINTGVFVYFCLQNLPARASCLLNPLFNKQGKLFVYFCLFPSENKQETLVFLRHGVLQAPRKLYSTEGGDCDLCFRHPHAHTASRMNPSTAGK